MGGGVGGVTIPTGLDLSSPSLKRRTIHLVSVGFGSLGFRPRGQDFALWDWVRREGKDRIWFTALVQHGIGSDWIGLGYNG